MLLYSTLPTRDSRGCPPPPCSGFCFQTSASTCLVTLTPSQRHLQIGTSWEQRPCIFHHKLQASRTWHHQSQKDNTGLQATLQPAEEGSGQTLPRSFMLHQEAALSHPVCALLLPQDGHVTWGNPTEPPSLRFLLW